MHTLQICKVILSRANSFSLSGLGYWVPGQLPTHPQGGGDPLRVPGAGGGHHGSNWPHLAGGAGVKRVSYLQSIVFGLILVFNKFSQETLP